MDRAILNLEEAAGLFGVSVKTFIKLLKEEKVPGRKIGREWRFSRGALIDWLSRGDSQSYSSSEGETREFFNEVAPDWEELSRGYYDASIKNKLIEWELLRPDRILLDLGTGDGYIARFAAPSVGKVLALDISGAMLRELERKAQVEGLQNIETVQGDGCDLPFADNSVDLVTANMYLHHIEEPEAAISEIGRVLRKGGAAFLADFVEHGDREMMTRMHDLWPGFAPETVRKWFINAGFRKINLVFPDDIRAGGATPRQTGVKPIFILTAYKATGPEPKQ